VTDDYRVQLDIFTGPLDLLLYLIRRDELDIQDIPLARLTEQYLEYVHLLEQLDPNTAGDFLVMASTLVELKSRALLPTPPPEGAEDEDDPQKLLVRQLLEYKRFKDAAAALGSAAEERASRFARRPAGLPRELEGVELEEAQVWDLLSAFGRVMSAIGQGPGLHEVTYDDTPIAEYRDYILDTLERRGTIKFHALFSDRFNRGEIVGLFLALLELLRWQRVRAEQDALHGSIYLFLPLDVSEPDNPDEAAAHEPSVSLAPRIDESPEPQPEATMEIQDEQTE
jgi:segregation and condensation protein A